jgi:hypothetical protein
MSSDLTTDLNALRLRALQRDLAASGGVQSAAPVSTAAHDVEAGSDLAARLKESSGLSGDGAATSPRDDRIWREVQRRINASEEAYIDRRALLNQHVMKAERTLAAAVTYQQNICDPPARLGIPGASTEALINRARDVVGAQMEADQDGRDHLKDAVASTHKELWCSALQLADVQ